ncbi:N-acetylglucosamine-6-phosphate deacetylase [Candidatus Magnetobacterium bavaricum]|uniref:N-acetylglucosamine-6-phosphate deacetylase n=1 Tax=Candidatus Magnetobacterium bavaricum TaxID=29290 RepID=A0A0F3GM57_9BACT|nr:N-acetylglucosamine-6-phosphate deacetylase [Candidatus Magnetobacterium bavaricum]
MEVIDIHTHGIGSFDTETASRKQIAKIAELHAQTGVEMIIPTIYAAEIDVMRLHVLMVKKAMEMQESSENTAISQARIIGVHLEGPFLNPQRCGALNKNAFIPPSEKALVELLDDVSDIVRIITVAPELDGAIPLIRQIRERGILVSMGHSDATYSEAEAGFYAGASGVTHLFNAMRPLHHREPGIAGFALTNKDIYVEVIADPYHLHQKTISLIFSVKAGDKVIIVSDTVKETKSSHYAGGITNTSNTLMGGSITVMEAAKRLIKNGFSEELIMGCITANPAAYLGLHSLQ